MDRLALPTVTLCAVTSVNVEATVAALRSCLRQVNFCDALLLTDREVADLPAEIRKISIPPIDSATAYSHFVLRELAGHIASDHCLLAQWDGFVADSARWDDRFLDYDFIGAPWPQFSDGHDVGNGGFSLRSRKLLEACRSPGFAISHPEDVAIGRINRDFLEREHGIRFPDRDTAARFSFERSRAREPSFGFHGVFNMVEVLGERHFWELYETLDDRTTIFADYRLLMRQAGSGSTGLRRRTRLTIDGARRLIRGLAG